MSSLAIKFEPLAVDVTFTDTMLRVVPPREIDEAIRRKQRFEENPGIHTYQEE